MKIQDLIKRSQQDVTEGTKQEILFYAKLPDGSKVYARVKDEEQWADLQQKYRGAEIKTFDYNRPDVLDWLEARRINLRKFVPGMVQTMYESAEEKQRLDPTCWDGYKKSGTKLKGNTRVNNCVPESLEEIDRRGFLKGMGAAAVTGAAGGANAAFNSDDVAGWFISTETSKFGELTKRWASKGSLYFTGNDLYYFSGSGKSPNFTMIKPGSLVKYKIDGGPVKTTKASSNSSVSFMHELSKLANAKTLDLRYTYIDRIRDEERTVEIEADVAGLNEVIEYFKNPQQYKKKDEPNDAQGVRQSNLDRMSGSSPSASYASRIVARIKPNITFTDEVQGNPKAEVEVRTSSNGTIINRKLLSSSGNKVWDEAVLKAIDKTDTLPRNEDGRVPPVLHISFRPKD